MATNPVFTKTSRGWISSGRNRAALNASRRQRAVCFVRWGSFAIGKWFSPLLNTKSRALDTSVAEELSVWPPWTPLDDIPSIFEAEENVKSVQNRKAVGPDELPAELLKLASGADRDGNHRMLQ